jgi:ERCC4-type nuclease
MPIYLDCRENALIQRMPGVEVKQLTLGDVLIEVSGKEIIIERKTLADLAASIVDGRYREQSERLAAYDIPNHNIMYLIEGSFKTYRSASMPKKTLLASMVSLLYGKGFSVVRTDSPEETVEFLEVMHEKLQKEDGYAHAAKENASSVKKERKDKITPETIDALMLAQVPYVSTVTAEAVLAVHKTVFGLVDALQKDAACLDALKYGVPPRKISSKSVQSIKTFLKI